MREVQYLANGLKVENPVYILSNEMLKFIYDSYEGIMQIFHNVWNYVINLFCIV